MLSPHFIPLRAGLSVTVEDNMKNFGKRQKRSLRLCLVARLKNKGQSSYGRNCPHAASIYDEKNRSSSWPKGSNLTSLTL